MKKMTKKARTTLITAGLVGGLLICLLVLFLIYTPNISDFVSGLNNRFPLTSTQNSPETEKSENNATLTGTPAENPSGMQQAQNPNDNTINATVLPNKKTLSNPDEHRILLKGLEEYPGLKNGSYVDLRVRYPNGEDYSIIRNLYLYALPDLEGKENLYVDVTESELLYVSSAVYDQKKYTETLLYASLCLEEPKTASELGNYRPAQDIITLINEEKMLDKEKADELFLARERLEGRLLLFSSNFIQGIEDDLLEGGWLGDTSDGYWIYN